MTDGLFNRTRMAEVMTFEAYLKLNKLVQRRQKFPETAKIKTVQYFSGTGANLLTAICIYWIKSRGYFASRQNSTGIPEKRPDGSIKWRPATGMKGSGDIYAIVHQGRSLWVEIKFGRDRQSEAQKKFEKAVTDQGALYWIVRTFDDLLAKMDDLHQPSKIEMKRGKMEKA